MTGHVGNMRHRINLKRATNTTDTGGGMTQSFSTLKTLFASVKPISGKELYRHGKLEESVTHEIMIRYRSDINTSDKILFDSREFNIRHIRNLDERKRYMLLICTEGDAL
jgi:SPP1 family predicted phage head-tail adaptor|tara:strand:+ start:815 stop:1144 length:330 start_codon:yes stop_codon:yes gene_type:complete